MQRFPVSRIARMACALLAAFACVTPSTIRTSFAGAVPAGAAESAPAKFPDDWYFGGLERSPALRAIEGKPSPGLVTAKWIGDELSPRDMRGKVVVVDFWATWCGPCVRAIPENVQLVNELKDEGLVFVGIHDANSGWDTAPQVVSQKGINYPVALDASGTDSSAARFKLSFFPTYVVIDRAGIVRAAGLLPNRVEDVVRALLGEGVSTDEVSGSDFSPDNFYGGTSRPATLRAVEGRPAPAFKGVEWIGEAPVPLGAQGAGESPSVESGGGKGAARAPGATSVVFFFAPESAFSAGEFDKVVPIAKALDSVGVRVIGVCDASTKREALKAFLDARKVDFPVLLDEPPAEGAAPNARGTTATAFGARFAPATIVVDSAGTVRGAGVRADRLRAVLEKLLKEQDPDIVLPAAAAATAAATAAAPLAIPGAAPTGTPAAPGTVPAPGTSSSPALQPSPATPVAPPTRSRVVAPAGGTP